MCQSSLGKVSKSAPLSASFPPTWMITVVHSSISNSLNLDVNISIVASGTVLTAPSSLRSFVFMFFKMELPIRRVDCFIVCFGLQRFERSITSV